MSRILLMLLAAAFALLPAFDAFAQPITRVYRADTRPPQQIFAHGFHGRGDNMDLLAHTLGESCEELTMARASAWVSTSAERATAVTFAQNHLETLESGPQNAMLVYTIRPDHTYLDVRGVMLRAVAAGHAAQQGYTPVQAHVLDNLIYSTVIGGEQEVVTHYVSPANIVSAQYIYFDANDDLVESQIVLNTAYRDENTQVSSSVANLQAFVPSASIRIDYGANSDTDSSCSMTCDGAGPGSASRKRSAGSALFEQCEVRSGDSPLVLDIINSDE